MRMEPHMMPLGKGLGGGSTTISTNSFFSSRSLTPLGGMGGIDVEEWVGEDLLGGGELEAEGNILTLPLVPSL